MSRDGYLELGDGTRLAYCHTPGRTPTVVFLGGFASDMSGQKALYLEARCARDGRAFLRLDYRGHGASSGAFEDGTIGRWAADARAVIESVTEGPLVLVGSSMGGWIMLLVARALGARVLGLVGIAAAPDFTEDLMLPALSPAQIEALERDGVVRLPSDYPPGHLVVSRRLVEEARGQLQLRAPIPLRCPVRLVHGMDDGDVPWRVSLDLTERLESDDVRLTLIKGAGHRLSEPAELALVGRNIDEVLAIAEEAV